MTKDLPYFKFKVAYWLTGDIVFESLSVQGLFINICAIYWQRRGVLSLEDIMKRYKNPPELTELNGRFFSVNNGFISISFLDEQFEETGKISGKNSQNGKKGGRPKAAKTLEEKPTVNPDETEPKPKKSNIEKKRKEKSNVFTPPSLGDVESYFSLKGYSGAKKAFEYYDAANWRDSKGNQVKNWKQKMVGIWFTEENKIKSDRSTHPLYNHNTEREIIAYQTQGWPLETRHQDYLNSITQA